LGKRVWERMERHERRHLHAMIRPFYLSLFHGLTFSPFDFGDRVPTDGTVEGQFSTTGNGDVGKGMDGGCAVNLNHGTVPPYG